ncbi:MAG: esterase/lipase family protein, partial [Acidimicrobiales bacterium]
TSRGQKLVVGLSLAAALAAPGVALASVGPAAPSPPAPAPPAGPGPATPAVGQGTGTGIYAPLERPGPALDVAPGDLSAALVCPPGLSGAGRDPILLIPGTELDPGLNFGWNYELAFNQLGWPYCTITLPGHTTDDIQRAGEYIVYALRTMHDLSGRKVDILGYSQGGMVPRWALRFWPDTRGLVDAFVALDPSNHGTLDANVVCELPCSAADWQQSSGAHFIEALNSGAETFAGISYTVVFSRTDEIVVPNVDSSGSSSLHTGGGQVANIAVQEICPNDASEHFAMGSYDPVGYALAVDAFTHTGPADPTRIGTAVCASAFQPGVDPVAFPGDYAAYLNGSGTSDSIPAEPPLAAYVYAIPPS